MGMGLLPVPQVPITFEEFLRRDEAARVRELQKTIRAFAEERVGIGSHEAVWFTVMAGTAILLYILKGHS